MNPNQLELEPAQDDGRLDDGDGSPDAAGGPDAAAEIIPEQMSVDDVLAELEGGPDVS